MKRFITEYARYKINAISDNDIMRDDIKAERIRNIEKAVRLAKNSFITVDECIKMIAET